MKRRNFIKQTAMLSTLLLAQPVLAEGHPLDRKKTSRFGIIADVHRHYFPFAEERLTKFLKAAEAAEVDFIVSLGDFSYPEEKNKSFAELWKAYPGPKYQVLGNHDMDISNKEHFLEFVGQRKLGPYFSFDQGGFHYVVLDNNFIKTDHGFIPYENKNYVKYPRNQIACISPPQLQWLKSDLQGTDKPTVIFLHQPINSLGDGQELTEILKGEHGKRKKVIAVFSGHNHMNRCFTENDIHHVHINSASYHYVGPSKPKYKGRYAEQLEKEYPLLPSMAPYDDALFAIVDLDSSARSMDITGRKANFVAPSPYELGYYTNPENQMNPSSNIDSRFLKF